MTNKTLFKKKCRKYLSFFEEKEGFEALVHDKGILYTRVQGEVLTRASFFFDSHRSPFRISTVILKKRISLIEKMVEEVVESKSTIDNYTIMNHLMTPTRNPYLALPKEMLDVANEVIVLQESDIEAAATIIKEYFYSKETQDFLNLTIEDLNQQLLECEELDNYIAGIFCVDGNGYLRTYIVAKYFNNQRVFDWFDSFIIPWLNTNKASEKQKRLLGYIEKVNQLFNSEK